MEQRKKFMQEQLLFENYLSTLNTVNTVSPSVSSAASGGGGPAPSPSTPVTPIPQNIIVKIDTDSNWQPGDWGVNNTSLDSLTKVAVNVGMGVSTTSTYYNPFEVTIDWGDGIVETYNSHNYTINGGFGSGTKAITHSYASKGIYDIEFTGPSKFDCKFGSLPIVEIVSYPVNGDTAYFSDTTRPHLGWRFNFANWSGYNPSVGKEIENWDVSQIESFAWTFGGYSIYQSQNFSSGSFVYPLPNVENWDVSSGTDFRGMFIGQANFSQSLANWNVGNSTSFNYMFDGCYNLMSGARADLWDVGAALSNPSWFESFWGTFKNSMKTPATVGSMPHVGNWDISGITPGISNLFFQCWDGSGFSHTAIGQTLIGWASQSVVPANVGLASSAFSNTWDGSGFSNPTYSTGSAFGLEVSASYDYLVNTKGWTIPNFTFS
jgi:hypothetical protein